MRGLGFWGRWLIAVLAVAGCADSASSAKQDAGGALPGSGGMQSTSGGGSGGVMTTGTGGVSSKPPTLDAGRQIDSGSTPDDDAGMHAGDSDAGTDSGIHDPGTEGDGPSMVGPQFMDKNLDVRDGVPHGAVFTFMMDSNDSTIYPGLNGDYSRRVDVYVPKQYQDGDAAPFIVVQDGPGYTDRVKRALDNLISDHAAPALIAIMVDNGGGDSIGSERGLEYDTISDVYVMFVESEVLPAVKNDSAIHAAYPNLMFTSNPEGRAAMGCSSGAAAAFTMGWFGKDLYRRILSYSGTFVDQQDPMVPTYPNGAWEYHEHLIADSAMKPLRVYLEVGENDLRANDAESTLHNWVLANNRMFEALDAKGYHARFQFALGAGHCDGGAIGATLYDALQWLWRGYLAD